MKVWYQPRVRERTLKGETFEERILKGETFEERTLKGVCSSVQYFNTSSMNDFKNNKIQYF